MESFLNDAWASLSETFKQLELAEKAQEEDNDNNEELNRTSEQFVERIRNLQTYVGQIQKEISNILYEHNHQS